MVQQTKDSTCTEYRFAGGESSLSKSDKLLPVSVSTKKTELKDSYNDNTIMVSKSIGTPPLLVEDSGCAGEVVESSRTERPTPNCHLSPPKTNAGSAHIVYVRRKPETELARSNVCDNHSDAVDHPPLGDFSDRSQTTQQHAGINELIICKSNVSSTLRASYPSFSCKNHPVPPAGTSCNISSPGNIEHVHAHCADPSSNDPIIVNLEERFCRLQSLLKMLDQSDQDDYVEMLRSLSSVELSRHALELEKRSIKLSLEEAKEMQRVCWYDVLKNLSTHSTG